MARPSKFLRVISAGPLNFLQRDFEKYSSSRKKLYSRKNPKPKNDVFFDFRPKNNSFWYEKILNLRNFSKIFCKKSLNFMLNVPNIKFWKSEFLKCWSNFWNALHILLVSAAWATDFWVFWWQNFFKGWAVADYHYKHSYWSLRAFFHFFKSDQKKMADGHVPP